MLLTINAGLFTYMFTLFYIKSYKRDARARAIKESELLTNRVDNLKNYINSKNEIRSKQKGILWDNEKLAKNQQNYIPLNGYHSANQYYESPIIPGFQLDIKKDI